MWTVQQVIQSLETLAPLSLAEAWDQPGLQVGDPAWQVSRAMLCIDLTEAVLDEAAKASCELIVAYHPLMFKPLSRLTPTTEKQRITLNAARQSIAVYSPHTALDAAAGGVNDWLAAAAGKGVVRPIRAAGTGASSFKLVTFVPQNALNAVRDALVEAGAGIIGNYSHCSYELKGQGTFKGNEASNPAVGEKNVLERVDEVRLEMVVDAGKLSQAVEALWTSHPYEEPAYDVYRLELALPAHRQSTTGQGRVVTLDEPTPLPALMERYKQALGMSHLQVALPAGVDACESVNVQTLGLCAGAGSSLLDEAGEIDLFITGEMRHHDMLAAVERGVTLLLAGHTQTERPYLPTYRDRLRAQTGESVDWQISKKDRAVGEIR